MTCGVDPGVLTSPIKGYFSASSLAAFATMLEVGLSINVRHKISDYLITNIRVQFLL